MITAYHCTTIEIWTDFPTHDIEIDALAREACVGDAICVRTHRSAHRPDDPVIPTEARNFLDVP